MFESLLITKSLYVCMCMWPSRAVYLNYHSSGASAVRTTI